MGRPEKYNWKVIREAYEKGFSKNEIVRKFRVPKAILTNRINKDKWSILCLVDSDVADLHAKIGAIAQNYTRNPEIEDMFNARISTLVEDTKLMGSNRKLLRDFQKLIKQGVKDGSFISPQDIKLGVSSIRDIEKIANPRASKTEINVNQTSKVAQQNNLQVEYL